MRAFISIALVAFGIAVCWAGITIGQADDAPGAGVMGIVILLATLVAAFKIMRNKQSV